MIPEADIAGLLSELGKAGAVLEELAPQGTVRTFVADGMILRVDANPEGDALASEALALDALASGASEPIAPNVQAKGTREIGDELRPWLAYPFIGGRSLTAHDLAVRAAEVGRLYARLHSARVFDLRARFPRRGAMTLMESFKKMSDRLRAWSTGRESDGLGQDELTLALSDLQRALRRYAIGLDHLFLPARRRALCHVRAEPRNVIASDDGRLYLATLDNAHLGDPAEDLARLSLTGKLNPVAEDALLHGYLQGLDLEERPDPRFIPRFFARRTLGLFDRAVDQLDRLRRLKSGELHVLGDPVVAFEDEVRTAYDVLAAALAGLSAISGFGADTSVDDVKRMGRPVAYEELILRGRSFNIAITGLPYAGKTEVGAALARRLGHTYLNTGAAGRALALYEAEHPSEDARPPRRLVKEMLSDGFVMEPDHQAPHYRVLLQGVDVTARIHEGEHRLRGAALLDDEGVREAAREELARRVAGTGLIVEGHYAASFLTGRPRQFHLTCDPAVRRARLRNHRPEVESDDEASDLLARLDEATPAPLGETQHIDLRTRPAAAGALAILWHLLPAGRRPQVIGS